MLSIGVGPTDRLDVLEELHRQLHARRGDALAALRPDAGGAEAASDFAAGVDAGALEHEDVLHRDHVAFHAGDLGDLRHAARAVGHARAPAR